MKKQQKSGKSRLTMAAAVLGIVALMGFDAYVGAKAYELVAHEKVDACTRSARGEQARAACQAHLPFWQGGEVQAVAGLGDTFDAVFEFAAEKARSAGEVVTTAYAWFDDSRKRGARK